MTDEALDKIVNDLKLNLPEQEIPAALEKVIDDKHQGELEDLLLKLYEQKAVELKEEILAMMEEKIGKQQEIRKQCKDRTKGIDALISRTIDDGEVAKLEAQKKDIEIQMQKEIKELEDEYKKTEASITKDVQKRCQDREVNMIEQLQQRQIEEKKKIFQHYLPDSLMTTLHDKLGEQERKEIEQLRKDLEA